MRRREFIVGLGGLAAALPIAARSQQAERQRRIGVLLGLAESDPEGQARLGAFLQVLQQLGWTDGRNIQIVRRYTDGDNDRARALAAELVALAPDVSPDQRRLDRRADAAGDPHRASRVRRCRRSGRCRLR